MTTRARLLRQRRVQTARMTRLATQMRTEGRPEPAVRTYEKLRDSYWSLITAMADMALVDRTQLDTETLLDSLDAVANAAEMVRVAITSDLDDELRGLSA